MSRRVFFDANAGTVEGGFLLWFPTSERDLDAFEEEPYEGMSVTIYHPGELEFSATLKRDEEFQCWRGLPLPGTLRYLDGSSAKG